MMYLISVSINEMVTYHLQEHLARKYRMFHYNYLLY